MTNASQDEGERVPSLAVLPKEGLFDSYLSYPSLESGSGGKLRFLKTAAKIRLAGFDTVVYLMTRSRSEEQIDRDAAFFRLCGISEILGISTLKSRLLGAGAAVPLPRVESEGDFLLSIVSGFGPNGNRESDLLALTVDELEAGGEWVKKNVPNNAAGRRLVGIGPGSKWPSKIWPEDRFEEVIRKLAARQSIFPIVFGGPEDSEKGRRLIKSWGTGACAAGELNVRVSAAVLSECQLYLGNDTGTMHLAAAAGVRCVAAFAAVDYPGRWEPSGSGHKIFRVGVPCEGCHSADCFNDNLCLTSISVKVILEACEEILNADG